MAFQVALRKESVDRNSVCLTVKHKKSLSLSARRAWIEILKSSVLCSSCMVALRKESVDRNDEQTEQESNVEESLSARRAWIEILLLRVLPFFAVGSLSARRAWIEISSHIRSIRKGTGRSPQGERG